MLCYFKFLLFFFLLYYTMCLPFSPVLNTLLPSSCLFHSLLWMSLNVLLHIFLNTLLQEFSPLKYTVTLFFLFLGGFWHFCQNQAFHCSATAPSVYPRLQLHGRFAQFQSLPQTRYVSFSFALNELLHY